MGKINCSSVFLLKILLSIEIGGFFLLPNNQSRDVLCDKLWVKLHG